MKKVFVHNLAGRGNAGDDFILYSLIEQLRSIYAVIYFSNGHFSLKKSEILEGISEFFSFKPLFSPGLIKAIKCSDKVIIGGGQLIQDFRNPFLSGLGSSFIIFILAKLFSKKVILYSIGASKLRKLIPVFMLKIIVRNAEKIFVRDTYSLEILNSYGAVNIELTNDSVFGMADFFTAGRSDIKRDLMLICGTEYNAEAMNAVSEKVDPALKRLAVIMDARFDGITARDKEKYDFNKIKAEEIKGILNRTSCVITDRMHLCILAYISGVPGIFVFGRDGDKLKYIAELLKIPLLRSGFDDISVFPPVIQKKIEVKKLT